MILPTKRIAQDRALLYLGGNILAFLDEPKTVSRLWDEIKRMRTSQPGVSSISYDWFVLALDLLFTICAIEYEHGRVRKAVP